MLRCGFLIILFCIENGEKVLARLEFLCFSSWQTGVRPPYAGDFLPLGTVRAGNEDAVSAQADAFAASADAANLLQYQFQRGVDLCGLPVLLSICLIKVSRFIIGLSPERS